MSKRFRCTECGNTKGFCGSINVGVDLFFDEDGDFDASYANPDGYDLDEFLEGSYWCSDCGGEPVVEEVEEKKAGGE